MPLNDFARKTTTIRRDLVDTLRLDLIGPDNKAPQAREIIEEEPNVRYLTGFLVPECLPLEERRDEDADDDNSVDEDPSGDDGEAERMGGRDSFLPSSIGLSVLIPAGTAEIHARVGWGDYVRIGSEDPADLDFCMELDAWAKEVGLETVPTYPEQKSGYARIPRDEGVRVPIPGIDKGIERHEIGRGRGLCIEVFCRSAEGIGLPPGTRSVSVFLVNRRPVLGPRKRRYPGIAFQVELDLNCEEGFIARPDLKALAAGEKDWDEKVGDIQYRDLREYVVGHNVSSWADTRGPVCHDVSSSWFPEAEVEKVVPASIEGLELGMAALGALETAADVDAALSRLPDAYGAWATGQRAVSGMPDAMVKTRDELIIHIERARSRIQKGISALKEDAAVLDAFRVANRAMDKAARQRRALSSGGAPSAQSAPRWYPFQLAFVILSIPGIASPETEKLERETVDLLFFPTGGGKTEAYLGLAAFTMVLRRFRNPETLESGISIPSYDGLTVLMRYTLRLLTLDQLGRAAALVCALELERKAALKGGDARLGGWPFEIGLWVGSGATPNRLGKKGDKHPAAQFSAYARWMAYQNGRTEAPIPLQSCPWCGTPFEKNSFRFIPNVNEPRDLVIRCQNYDCELNSWDHLPIVAVDEPLYRRLPAFVIATVDKFAALPWVGQAGMLFGKVKSFHPERGFYGQSEADASGVRLEAGLPPPDLIIQDELHLISGPLGTIAGLYEAAIGHLCERRGGGVAIGPKIIASTATVRRAEKQIAALFGRRRSSVFPAPGPDRRDSFFARAMPSEEMPARLYLGVSAPGRSVKVATLRVILALLCRAEHLYVEAGAKKANPNPADAYMTLLCYFNSLRELGGTRRIVEDEVIVRAERYQDQRRLYPEESLFKGRKIVHSEISELTSRESTSKIADTKRRLEIPYGKEDALDIALATNMISVGLDIVRLGLMIVNGQPKSASEYIQSTSRVGRDSDRPGLVVTVFNPFKARDRSHYERFSSWHGGFYRSVEAASVTPFSPRALERAMAPALVGLVRHAGPGMAAPSGASMIRTTRTQLEEFVGILVDRARNAIDADLPDEEKDAVVKSVESTAIHLLDAWEKIAVHDARNSCDLFYDKKDGGKVQQGTSLLAESLCNDFNEPAALRARFKANRSMRDVEAPVEVLPPARRDGNG